MSELMSEAARRRAAGKARRAERVRRREAYFDLLTSGYSVEQIAGRMGMSASAVRRAVRQAVAARRLDAPEDFAKLQMGRLMKALRCADERLETGDLKAVAPFLRAVDDLNRFYGLAAGALRLAPLRRAAEKRDPPAAPLALAHAAPALEADAQAEGGGAVEEARS